MNEEFSLMPASTFQGMNYNTDFLTDFQKQFGLGDQNSFGNAGNFNLNGLGDTGNSWFSPQAMQLGSLGINAVGGLVNAYTGLRGLSLAKDQFKFNKGLALTNLQNNANLTNERLATRQATRLRSQGITDADQIAAAVDSYMAKYGVSGKTGG